MTSWVASLLKSEVHETKVVLSRGSARVCVGSREKRHVRSSNLLVMGDTDQLDGVDSRRPGHGRLGGDDIVLEIFLTGHDSKVSKYRHVVLNVAHGHHLVRLNGSIGVDHTALGPN